MSTYLLPHEVEEPNIADPRDLAKKVEKREGPAPDFYIWYPNPDPKSKNPELIYHVPCRELHRGEIVTLGFAVEDHKPEVPEEMKKIRIEDYNEEQRKWYIDFEDAVHALERERNILATVRVILSPHWNEEFVRLLLPPRTHRQAYMGGTAAQREEDPVVRAFLRASNQRTQTRNDGMPPDDAQES